MKLKCVRIHNFRSLKNAAVDFDSTCRVLVGINETGKSNVLRALALLDPEQSVRAEDVREFPDDEPLDQDCYVRFEFALESAELSQLYDTTANGFLTDKPNTHVVTIDNRHYSLKQFCDLRNTLLYRVDVRTGERRWQYWTFNEDAVVPAHLMRAKTSASDMPITTKAGTSLTLGAFSLIDMRGRESVLSDHVEPITSEQLGEFVGSHMIKAKGSLPTCIFWRFDEEQLLPGKISTAQFVANPEMCPPLKSMFELAGVEAIDDTIASAQARSNGMPNLLKRVARQATKHFHDAWHEYRDVRFQLLENGAHITAVVEDVSNSYDMARRSDGFKKFISFLLLVSARERSRTLANALYLHDEPETSLHPSGARYMREELLKLSRTNVVVYSTHSTFMIDRKVIRRHYIVKKDNEITTLTEAAESNIHEEEVLFQALGTSTFETLCEWNIVFEGWRDRHLYDVATSRWPSGMGEAVKTLSGVGTCYANGVAGVDRVTPMIQLARKHCVIVSDGDDTAKRYQETHRRSGGYGKWVRYDELLAGKGVVTGEDFVRVSAWPDALQKARKLWPTLPEIPATDLEAGNRLGVVDERAEKAGIPREERKRLREVVKETLFEGLKRSQVEETYYEALAELVKYVGQ